MPPEGDATVVPADATPEADCAYDVVDYPGHPRPQTHPDVLAAIARLHGLPAASPRCCRYLEVGCGDGANLLPLALAYPDSSFIGVDLSHKAIARGEQLRMQLGLDNLLLQVADLGSWEPGPVPFDFVAAHGFYSWVPEAVRDALMRLCREHLAAAGVAYVSYNAMPGCHIRRMIAQMLRAQVQGIEAPELKLTQAIAMLKFLDAGVIGDTPYAQLVRHEVASLVERTDPAVVFHDDLSDVNHAVSITEFAAHAGAFELAFLGEADYFEMSEEAAPPAVVGMLKAMAAADVLRKEQYLDFLKGRRFRQTLLCRRSQPLQREVDPRLVLGLHVVGQVESRAEVDLALGAPVSFRAPQEAAFSVDHPVPKAAMQLLGERWPAPIAVDELLEQAQVRCMGIERSDAVADVEALARTLLLGFRLGVLSLLCDPPQVAAEVGSRPCTSALVRAQVAQVQALLTSVRGAVVDIPEPAARELLGLLDGSRDRSALLLDVGARLAVGVDNLSAGSDPTQRAACLELRLEEALLGFRRLGLLKA